ncbi:MAG: GyrI-like domain-containing protein [Proteobacteria bacterium]|nr:GyrI-like domain-containing protein [Pseudomonadota bacterium]
MTNEPRIVDEHALLVVGMSFFGDPFNKASGWSEENEIGLLWKRLMRFLSNNPEAIKHRKDDGVFLEIHIYTDETAEKGICEVFVGTVVDRLEEVPIQCVVKQLPATRYGVFTFKGEAITADWDKDIYQEWLPTSGYEGAHSFNFQYYDERFKSMEDIAGSELDVYVPIKSKT